LIGDPYVFLVSAVFLVPAALIAIPVHELAHGLAASAQGDPTARNRGFLRPNPRLFIEPYGLLAVFLAKIAWGQPVPVNEHRLRGLPGRLAYALAGPAANLVLGVVFGLAVRALLSAGYAPNYGTLSQPAAGYLASAVYAIFFLNLSVFAFNLLPIPGLDGWRVLEALLRSRYPKFFFDASVRRREIWMIAAIIVFVGSFLSVNLLSVALLPLFAPASTLILGGCAAYPGLAPCPASGRL
jgi:Zn-dependent protease